MALHFYFLRVLQVVPLGNTDTTLGRDSVLYRGRDLLNLIVSPFVQRQANALFFGTEERNTDGEVEKEEEGRDFDKSGSAGMFLHESYSLCLSLTILNKVYQRAKTT